METCETQKVLSSMMINTKKNCVARFVSNLKIALRKAYGINGNYRTTSRGYDQDTFLFQNANENSFNGSWNNMGTNSQNFETLKNDLRRRLLAAFDF